MAAAIFIGIKVDKRDSIFSAVHHSFWYWYSLDYFHRRTGEAELTQRFLRVNSGSPALGFFNLYHGLVLFKY